MTEASTGTGSPSSTALPSGPVWQAGLLAALAATVVNAVAWLVVQQLFDAGLQIPKTPGGTELTSLPRARSCSSRRSRAWSGPWCCGC